jgi:Domain of unknown function (DUF4149)
MREPSSFTHHASRITHHASRFTSPFHSALGRCRASSYYRRVIGFLRFVGIINAAVWFGSSIFFSFGAGLAPFSSEMKSLLGPANYPYFSGAIAEILIARYFHFLVVCSLVAVVHLLAEWLYLSRYPQKFQVGLVVGLCLVTFFGTYGLQPKLRTLHAIKYAVNTPAAQRAAADRSFRTWHGVAQGINLLFIAGLAAYLWRVANPSDPTRFVRPTRFTIR